ncbi:transposase [Novosphingobium resinovorum]|uniref:Transposase n=1 Tax=Novosphingobium resinovorum TaxID=158500 RepID=A0A031JG32_9SPHN|nr:transposase [Novosphingobium resinovorum]
MDDFKGRHFTGEVILWAVRWYCRYGISYRDLEEMLAERAIMSGLFWFEAQT